MKHAPDRPQTTGRIHLTYIFNILIFPFRKPLFFTETALDAPGRSRTVPALHGQAQTGILLPSTHLFSHSPILSVTGETNWQKAGFSRCRFRERSLGRLLHVRRGAVPRSRCPRPQASFHKSRRASVAWRYHRSITTFPTYTRCSSLICFAPPFRRHRLRLAA